MKLKYRQDGFSQMTRTFKAVADAVGKDGVGTHTEQWKDVLIKPAEEIRDDARAIVPVETGRLQNAIFAAKGPPDKPGVIYGVNQDEAPYAPDVEYGTSRMAAHPFMRPAVATQRASFPESVAPGIGELIEGVASQNAYHPPGT